MRCVFCKEGQTKFSRVTLEKYDPHGNIIALVKNFPAEVCQNCGEEYYQAKDLKKIEKDLKAKKPTEKISVPVFAL